MPPALPPRIGHPSGIDVATRRQMHGCVEAVLRVGNAPLTPQGAAIGAPVARAACVVDAGDGKTPAREELQRLVEARPDTTTWGRRGTTSPAAERSPPGPRSRPGWGGRACRAPARPVRPVNVKGSPVATSPARSVTPACGRSGRAPSSGVPEPDGGRARRACCRSGPARLRARTARQWRHTVAPPAPAARHSPGPSGIQRDQRVPAGRRHPRHDRAVGRLRDGALAEHPVRAVELCLQVRERRWFRPRAREARVDVGLPPPPVGPTRTATTRPGPMPAGRPTPRDRRRRVPRVLPARARRDRAPRGRRGRAAAPPRRRGVPRHVRVIPGHHGQAVGGRVRARRPEEIVPIEQRGLARLLATRRECDHAAHRATAPLAVDLPDREHPVTVSRRAETTVVVHLARRRRPPSEALAWPPPARALRDRRSTTPAGPSCST